MKKLFSILSFLFILSGVFAQDNKTETITIQTKIYCDHCMECPDCGINLFRAVKKQSGIKNVEVQPESNTIEVTYKPNKTTPEEIRQSIADIGFKADNLEPSASAYEQLDACCKKP